MINSFYFKNLSLDKEKIKVTLLFWIMQLLFITNPAMNIFCKLIPTIYLEYINNNEYVRVGKVFSTYLIAIVLFIVKSELLMTVV